MSSGDEILLGSPDSYEPNTIHHKFYSVCPEKLVIRVPKFCVCLDGS